MPETDHPLKTLILAFKEVFVAWLLGEPPHRVEPLNVELLASAQRSDLVFEVTQANGQTVILHLELQGPGSHQPMGIRMLDYMSRLARRENLLGTETGLVSVVLYLGHGAGRGDHGHYEIRGPGRTASLSWRYQVVRLWEVAAETLLALGEPALLPLIGQTQLTHPEEVLPRALAEIEQVEDEESRRRLLAGLVSLISEQEVLEMVEKMIDAGDEWLLALPYLRRIRQEGLAEGKAEGIAEGKAEGLREAILEIVTIRFNPPAIDYRHLQTQLDRLTGRPALQQVLSMAIRVEAMTALSEYLDEMLPDS